MSQNRLKQRLLATTAFIVLAVAGTGKACAALGGDVDSIVQDRIHTKAMLRTGTAVTPASANYSVHELLTPAGTAVREFVSAGGKVFAVTWSGPAMPDLRQLLGPYFADFSSTTAPRTGGHMHRSIERSDLVVRSTGRMRAFSGKAYVPSLIPTGVLINDLQ